MPQQDGKDRSYFLSNTLRRAHGLAHMFSQPVGEATHTQGHILYLTDTNTCHAGYLIAQIYEDHILKGKV